MIHPPSGPPSASTLLPPAETSASLTPACASRRAMQPSAYPLPMLPRFSSTPSRANRTVRVASSSRTRSTPVRDRAPSISAGAGSRPSRRRNPQHRLSGVDVMSNAPLVSADRARHSRSSANNSSSSRTGAAAAPRFTRTNSLVSRNTAASTRSASSRARRAAGTCRAASADSVTSKRQAIAVRCTLTQ